MASQVDTYAFSSQPLTFLDTDEAAERADVFGGATQDSQFEFDDVNFSLPTQTSEASQRDTVGGSQVILNPCP